MQIVSAPPAYSPAYRDAIFGITADPVEVVTLDIYGCSQAASGGQTVLTGKKRVTGMDGYDINVANYAKRLLSVTPLAGGECGLFKPEGRMVDISVRSGDVSEGTTLNAGIFPYENPVFDMNGDGEITIGEFRRKLEKLFPRETYGPLF